MDKAALGPLINPTCRLQQEFQYKPGLKITADAFYQEFSP